MISEAEVAKAYGIRKKPGTPDLHIVHQVSDRCDSCRYISRECDHGGMKCCDYIGYTGRARMCPAGGACSKYERAEDGDVRKHPLSRMPAVIHYDRHIRED